MPVDRTLLDQPEKEILKMAGQPKAPFYAVVALDLAGLVAFAVYRADVLFPNAR